MASSSLYRGIRTGGPFRRKAGIGVVLLLVLSGWAPLRASTFDLNTAGFGGASASFGVEFSSVDLSAIIPADFGGGFPGGHASLFSGYVLPPSPGQLLVANLIQLLPGGLAGYSGAEIAGVAASFFEDGFPAGFEGGSGAPLLTLQMAMSSSPQIGTAQPFSVAVTEPAPASVPEPGPATLVFLGCCVVAFCVALANRTPRNARKLAENAGASTWPHT